MLFNSLDFLIFFPHRHPSSTSSSAPGALGVAPDRSYYFYMCWNPRYALLMATSTASPS